jgi:hypothetical protein
MKTISILLIALLLSVNSQAKLSDILTEAKVQENIRDYVAERVITANVNLFDLNLFEGIGISSRYRYQIEPSYKSEFHTRIDKWSISAAIRPGDILPGEVSPLFINFNKGSEVYFVRQFKSKINAAKAIPYNLKHLPLTAKKAINNLKVGDFVSFPSKLAVAIGAKLTSLTAPVNVSADRFHIITGEFIVQVFKQKDNKVRLKLIAQKSYGKGTSTGAKASYSLFSINVLDKQIEKIVSTDLIRFGFKKEDGHQFIIDYIFDLNDVKASEAYNQILSSTYKFRDLKIFRKNINAEGIANQLISSYEKAETLQKEDIKKEQKRVERVFKGFNHYNRAEESFKFGLFLINYNKNEIFTGNNLTYENEYGERLDFYYPNFSYTKDRKLGLGFAAKKEYLRQSTFGLVPTDEEGVSESYADFGFTLDIRDEIFRSKEQKRVLNLFQSTIPKVIFDEIDWDIWKGGKKKSSARAYLQFIIKGNAFDSLRGMSFEEIHNRLIKFEKNRRENGGASVLSFAKNFIETITLSFPANKVKLRNLAVKIYYIINDDIKGREKIDRIMELRNNLLFEDFGFQFLISLLDQKELHKLIYFKLSLFADEITPVEYSFGERNYTKLYTELDYILNAIQNRSFDLRINEDTKSHLKSAF